MRKILSFLMLTACGSAPKASAPLEAVSPQYEAIFAYAPRRPAELGEAILTSLKIQGCLKDSPEAQKPDFAVGVEGYLDYKGVMEGIHVVSSGPLKACLTRELVLLPLGRGRAGPFKMQVTQKKGTEGGLPP